MNWMSGMIITSSSSVWSTKSQTLHHCFHVYLFRSSHVNAFTWKIWICFAFRRNLYGSNSIVIHVTPIIKLLFTQVSNKTSRSLCRLVALYKVSLYINTYILDLQCKLQLSLCQLKALSEGGPFGPYSRGPEHSGAQIVLYLTLVRCSWISVKLIIKQQDKLETSKIFSRSCWKSQFETKTSC